MKRKFVVKSGWTLMLFIIFSGCMKNDPAVLSGEIRGIVKIMDENQYVIEDGSGVKVEIFNIDHAYTYITASDGEFSLADVPIGKYEIKLSKDGYMDEMGINYSTIEEIPDEFYHIGGSGPTRLNEYIYQIPLFKFHLDSALYVPDLDLTDVVIFGPPPYDGLTPFYGNYLFFCFFNVNPEVSKDEFIFYKFGVMNFRKRQPLWDPPLMEIEYVWELSDLDSDSIFICIYPVPWGENPYLPVRIEALGQPSNIIGFPIK